MINENQNVLVNSWEPPKAAYHERNRAWLPCTEDFYHDALGAVPAIYIGQWWANSEPWKHASDGQPVYLCFRSVPGFACRMATTEEIRIEQTAQQFMNDIPIDLATRAHNGTSWTPEKRGNTECWGFAELLAADYLTLSELIADKPEMRATLDAEFERYRQSYRKKTIAHLLAKSRCISSAITGGSNFPVRRAEKANRVEHKRLDELLDFRACALKAIRRTLQPELAPIMAGDSDAVQRLEQKIEAAERYHAQMLAVNKAHKAYLKNPATLETSVLSDDMKTLVRGYKSRYAWEPHPIAPYQLTNNGATIRSDKKRLEQLKRAKAAPVAEVQGENARFEDCPPENRVRLFYPGKPSEEIRTRLKSAGFRWTPTFGCWQAYRNLHTIGLAKNEAGLPVEDRQAAA